MQQKRYIVEQINPHVKDFYVRDTHVPFESMCKKWWGHGDKRDKPFKTREEAQKLCDRFNQ